MGIIASVLIIFWTVFMAAVYVNSDYKLRKKWDNFVKSISDKKSLFYDIETSGLETTYDDLLDDVFVDLEEELESHNPSNPNAVAGGSQNQYPMSHGVSVYLPDTEDDSYELTKEQRKAILWTFLPVLRRNKALDVISTTEFHLQIVEMMTKLENIVVDGTYTDDDKKILNYLRRRHKMKAYPFE